LFDNHDAKALVADIILLIQNHVDHNHDTWFRAPIAVAKLAAHVAIFHDHAIKLAHAVDVSELFNQNIAVLSASLIFQEPAVIVLSHNHLQFSHATKEFTHILASSHSVHATDQALNADLLGIHIILVPAQLAGVAPIIPLANILESLTVNKDPSKVNHGFVSINLPNGHT